LKLAMVWLVLAIGGIAAILRLRPRCRCGQLAEDDGLGYGLCAACEARHRAATRDDEDGPLSMSPRALAACGVGQVGH
jgi:hypothetical protein